jgi:poly(hydroxyalkanoate) depolymerase family esterase
MIPDSTAGRWVRLKPTATRTGGIAFAPPGEGLPLVIALHGCDQNAADFAVGTGLAALAARAGFAVAFPETRRTQADTQLNPFHCWLWWVGDNQTRGGEPAQILAFADAVAERMGDGTLDRRACFVTGLSSGAAMAAILSAVYPERFLGAALHAGVAYGAAETERPQLPGFLSGTAGGFSDLMSFSPLNMMKLTNWATGALRALEEADHSGEEEAERILEARSRRKSLVVPTLILHGTEDEVVHPENARQLLLQLLQVADLIDNDADDDSVDAQADAVEERSDGPGGYSLRQADYHGADGQLLVRLMEVGRLRHAWSGGHPAGSYTDPEGPDATALTWAFFADLLARRALSRA